MQEKENLYKDLKGGNGKTLFKSTIMLTDWKRPVGNILELLRVFSKFARFNSV